MTNGEPHATPDATPAAANVGRMRRRIWRGLMALGCALGLAWLSGLVWFAAAVPDHERADAPGSAAAIVVLTGGSERLLAGLQALEANPSARLFISGVPAPVQREDLWRAIGVAPSARVAGRVDLGHAAADTQGNAEETAAWIGRTNLKTVRLVTAAYHMRRALLELRAQMPAVRFIPDPVYPANVKQDRWWLFPGTALLLATEYNKYLAAWLRLTLGLDSGLDTINAPPTASGSPDTPE